MPVRVFSGESGPIKWEVHMVDGAWLGVRPCPAYLGDDRAGTGVARHYRERGELAPEYRSGWLVFRHSNGVVIWSKSGYARLENGRVEGCYLGIPVAGRVEDEEEFALLVMKRPKVLLEHGVSLDG